MITLGYNNKGILRVRLAGSSGSVNCKNPSKGLDCVIDSLNVWIKLQQNKIEHLFSTKWPGLVQFVFQNVQTMPPWTNYRTIPLK